MTFIADGPGWDSLNLPRMTTPDRSGGRTTRPTSRTDQTIGWWRFPARMSDAEALDYLRTEGYSPEGFRMPILSAFGGWKDVQSAIVRRTRNRLLVKQVGRTTYA